MPVSAANIIRATPSIGMPGNTQTAFTAIRPGAIGAGVLQAITNGPLMRFITQNTNFVWPQEVPSPDQLIAAWSGGFLGDAALQNMLWLQGIDWTNLVTRGPANDPRARAWQSVVQMHRATFDLGFYLQQYRRDNSNLPLLVDVLKRHGIGDPNEQARYYSNYEDLPPSVYITLYHLRVLTRDQCIAYLQTLGIQAVDAGRLISASVNRPDPATARNLFNLGIIGDDDLGRYLEGAGIIEPDAQRIQRTLLNPPPSLGNVMQGAATHSWDQAFALRWLMDAGTSPEWDTWANRLGYNYPAGNNPYGQPDANAPTWKQVLWRSHWQWPGVGQWMQVLHRFRGDPNNPATWSVPGVVPPNVNTLSEVMTGQGIVPGAQPYLMGLLYSPMPLRLMRYVVQTQNPPKVWISGKLQDSGYSPADSDLMAQSLLDQAAERAQQPVIQLRKRTWSRFVTSVVNGYRDGSMDGSSATAALAGQGIDPPTIATMLATADMEVNDSIVNAVIRRAKSDWMAGRTSLAGAGQRLTNAGMAAPRIGQMLAAWQAERGEGRVVLSTEKVLSLLRQGFITYAEAVTRLDNLGWAKPDEALLLAQVQGQVAKDAAAAERAKELSEQRQLREMERLLKQAEATRKEILRNLEHQTPVASIMEWVRDGIWTAAEATNRLGLMGYDGGSIATMLAEEAVKKKGGPTTDAAKAKLKADRLRRLTPPAAIVKWYKDGLWSRTRAYQRLLLIGYTSDIANTMLDDATKR